jgi:DNA-binding NarL/FixJ family response regulator
LTTVQKFRLHEAKIKYAGARVVGNNGEPRKIMTIRVMIVSLNPLLRAGVRMILQNHRDLVVVAEASSASKAVEIASRDRPDLVLIDIDILGEEIIELIGGLQKAAEDCLILLLSDLKDEEVSRKALCSGAAGVFLKIQPAAVLITLIEGLDFNEGRVRSQRTQSVPIRINSRKEDTRELEKLASLTAREREITQLIGTGLKNKDIADRLCISGITVRHHLTSIFSKVEVSDRQKLLIWAHQRGLIDLRLAETPSALTVDQKQISA